MRRKGLRIAILGAFVALVAFCVGRFLTPERISHWLTSKQVSWPRENAAFTVRDVNITHADDYTSLTIQCTWNTPPKPWNRYRLEFDSRVKYPSGATYSDGISPLYPPGAFVIHHYVAGKPRWLSHIDIPIQCWDSTEKRDLGSATLSFLYWPSGNRSIIIQ